MQAISDHVGSYQGIAYCGLSKWTNEDLFLSFAYNFKNVTYVYNTRLLPWGGMVVLPVIKLFSNVVFLTIHNYSWTTKTCFAFVLDCLWFISSILVDLESYYMYVYVSSQCRSSLKISN